MKLTRAASSAARAASADRLRIDLALSSFHPLEVHAVLISCIFRPHLLFEQNVRTAAVYMLAIMNRTYGRFGYKPICDGGAFPFNGEIFGEWVDVLEHTLPESAVKILWQAEEL